MFRFCVCASGHGPVLFPMLAMWPDCHWLKQGRTCLSSGTAAAALVNKDKRAATAAEVHCTTM